MSKTRSRDPFTTPFDLILHFLLGPPVFNLHAKFEVSSFTVLEIWRVSQNLKSRSFDHFTTPFDLILHFLLGPPVANLCAKFEVSSFNLCRDMEGVSKFQKLGHVTLHDPF